MELRVGQTWLDKRRSSATSSFTILKMFTKIRPDGSESPRVKGVLVTGVDACNSHLREMHPGSVKSMFPYLAFDPEYPSPFEEDK